MRAIALLISATVALDGQSLNDAAISLLQIQANHKTDFATDNADWVCQKVAIPGPDTHNKEFTISCGPDGSWATPYCPTLEGCVPYCPNGCNEMAHWNLPHPNPNIPSGHQPGKRNLYHFEYCQHDTAVIAGKHHCETDFSINQAPGGRCALDCRNSENKSKTPRNPYADTDDVDRSNPSLPAYFKSLNIHLANNGHIQCPKGCVNECASYRYGNLIMCGPVVFHGSNAACERDGLKKWNPPPYEYTATLWCGETTTTTTTTTTAPDYVCKHYETTELCPTPRCSWSEETDSCADPPCSAHATEEVCGCLEECEWDSASRQCKPEMFEKCPTEGKPNTNDCPEGCTYVDNCEQCTLAAELWGKKYSTKPWGPSSGSRPQGCFRNRRFNVKCNTFEPGSKYPDNTDKVGPKRGKWPICKKIKPPKNC